MSSSYATQRHVSGNAMSVLIGSADSIPPLLRKDKESFTHHDTFQLGMDFVCKACLPILTDPLGDFVHLRQNAIIYP